MSLTDYQKKLILDIASQLRLAVKNKQPMKMKCDRASIDDMDSCTFKCTLPFKVFDSLYHLINDNDK